MEGLPDIIGYRMIQHRETGLVVTAPAPIYLQDFPVCDVALDQALCRYMDLWKFQDLMTTGELYFRRADKFDDPLEGTISEKGVHGTSASDLAFATATGIKEDYDKLSEYRKTSKACTFVNCWHINNNESKQMWDSYTESEDSVLIITSVGRLAKALQQPVMMAGVKYVKPEEPRTEFGERSLFFYKDASFSFEREYRLLLDLAMLGGAISLDDPKDFSRRVRVDLSELIHAIQPHPKATNEIKMRIKELVKRYLPDAVEAS